MLHVLRRPVTSFIAFAMALGMLVLAAGPASAAAVTIRITDRLDPAEVSVAVGTTVRWVNADDERHRMRSQSGPGEFDSGNLEPGESFSVTLRAAGTYTYLDERDDENARYVGRIVVGSGGGGTDSGGRTGSAAAATATVGMAGRQFSPATVTIAAGGSVTFRNDDDDEHTVTSSGDGFNSGTLNAGETWKRSFPTAGTFAYLCAFHPDMTGTVVVTRGGAAAPAPTPTPSASATPAPSAPPAHQGIVVEARDFAFEPASIAVAAGTRVTWQNVGVAPHTVSADDGTFESGLIAAAGSFSRVFAEPGTFAYVCTLHPDMRGTVEVTLAAASASSTAGPGEPIPAVGAGPGGGVAQPASRAEPQAGVVQPAGSRVIRLPDAGTLLRFGLAAVLVLAAGVLFGRTIRATVRPAA